MKKEEKIKELDLNNIFDDIKTPERIRADKLHELDKTFVGFSDADIMNYIRKVLTDNTDQKIINDYHQFNIREMGERCPRLRFNMSGYEGKTGSCTVDNLEVLNCFAYLGIYDYTHYLVVDFYKGCGDLHMRYWRSDENICIEDEHYSGWGTTEIIFDIFKRTIFSGKDIRRRS